MGVRTRVGTGVWLACVIGGANCLGEPRPYFSDSEGAPVLDGVVLLDADGLATARDLQGGVALRLKGENLGDPGVAVRVGDQNAEVVPDESGETGSYLTVLTPPGPVSGGPHDVTVATSRGVDTLTGSFVYALPADEVFAGEAGSIQIIGHADGTGDIRVGFWPEVRPRWAGSLFSEGALYYLPPAPGIPVLWQGRDPASMMARQDTVTVATSVRFEPVAQPDLSPVVLSVDDASGSFSICATGDAVAPFWRESVDYNLTLSGGVLSGAVEAVLTAPRDVTNADGDIEGLLVDDLGVVQVDDDRNLLIEYPPDGAAGADAAFVLLELVVEAPDRSLPEHAAEMARVVVRGEDDAGRIQLTPADLALLPSVDTDCALAARQLVAARLEGDVDAESTWEDAYAAHGCLDGPSPTDDYPWIGYIRLSRHHIHRVALPAGAAGCPTPGACDGDNVLVVDLVASQEVPAAFGPLADCEDLVDNDEDGLIDGADPGCSSGADTSEIDESGRFPCDDGIDNDGDGLSDYAMGDGGDPGCSSPSDSSEHSSELPCDNGIDDDGDGVADYRPGSAVGDPGCVSVLDSGEREDGMACDDGLDNDGDGGVDYAPGDGGDVGCDDPADPSEVGTSACDNGEDDDNDGYIDFRIVVGTGDPGCSGPTDDSEKYTPGPGDDPNAHPCDDGQDNDVDGWVDGDDPGCRDIPARQETYNPYEQDEHNPAAECDDDIDNDDDGYKDYRIDGNGDPECLSAIDNTEDEK